MSSRIKPKGTILSEFYSEGTAVRVRYVNDPLEWVTIAHTRTNKQAQALATQLNQIIGAIENAQKTTSNRNL